MDQDGAATAYKVLPGSADGRSRMTTIWRSAIVEAWDAVVPDLLMRIAQQCIEAPVEDSYGDTPIDLLHEFLGKPVPNTDVLFYARDELERLARNPKRAYEAVERLIAGASVYDAR